MFDINCTDPQVGGLRDAHQQERHPPQDRRQITGGAQLAQIRFEIEEARRDVRTREMNAAERAGAEHRQFWIQIILTSIRGLAMARSASEGEGAFHALALRGRLSAAGIADAETKERKLGDHAEDHILAATDFRARDDHLKHAERVERRARGRGLKAQR